MLPLYAAKLIRKLSEAKRHAEEANRAKSAFLASVSHDVRTPLNAIIGLGDLLHDQLRNPERKHMVSTIVNSGRSLLTLINSILDFSRIEAGRMPSKAVRTDLYEAIGQLKAMLAAQAIPQALKLGVHITARTPPHISADYIHIEADSHQPRRKRNQVHGEGLCRRYSRRHSATRRARSVAI